MCVCMCVVMNCLLPTATDSGDNGNHLIAMLVTAWLLVGVVILTVIVILILCVLRR